MLNPRQDEAVVMSIDIEDMNDICLIEDMNDKNVIVNMELR